MGCDIMARRAHPLKTIGCRLLAVNFYIEAIHWPAEFTFDHEEKIGALAKAGCPEEVLPHRGGRPYLWETVLIKADGKLCIAMIDRAQGSPLLQAWGFAKRYFQCLKRASNAVRLLVVVNSEARERRYRQVATHPKLQKFVWGGSATCLAPYRVQLPVPFIHSVAKFRREKR